MFDLIIKSGWILDGLGNPWYRGDIGITIGDKAGRELAEAGIRRAEEKSKGG